MPTTKPNAKKRRALSPPHTVVAKRAEVTDGTESETTTITLPIEFLKDLSTSVDTVTKGLMNMPSQVPAIRGQFVAMLSQIQTKIDGKLGIKKSVRFLKDGLPTLTGGSGLGSICSAIVKKTIWRC